MGFESEVWWGSEANGEGVVRRERKKEEEEKEDDEAEGGERQG